MTNYWKRIPFSCVSYLLSFLGRPTKVEGNPAHPASLGATDVLSQACVLDLYNPFRSKEILYQNQVSSWDALVVDFQQAMKPIRDAKGKGLSLLTEKAEAKWH